VLCFICFSFGEPLAVESVSALATALKTTTLERLSIHEMNKAGLETLVQSLPKTLFHLNLDKNYIHEDAIPVIHSYIQSNGSTLKELIINPNHVEEYLKQYGSSVLSTLEINNNCAWKEKLFHNLESISIDIPNMKDVDWSTLFMTLTKGDTICHEIDFRIKENLDQQQLNYLQTLFGEQFHLTSLIINDRSNDTSNHIELLRILKKNISITELRLDFEITSNVFRECLDLLTIKNNIIRLELPKSSNISDEEAIMLSRALKTNTVLQTLILEHSQIGDIGFQALLSSLSDSLSEFRVEHNLITGESLPYLLTFIKTHPLLREISLKQYGLGLNSTSEVNIPDLSQEIIKTADQYHCLCEINFSETLDEYVAQETNGDIILYDKDLQNVHILELCNELKKQPNRSWSLNLKENDRISSVGYGYLADILSSSAIIDVLSVNHMNEEAQTSLFRGLCKNMTLTKFTIESKLNSEDMKCIGRFVQNNSALKELEMEYCEIDANDVIHFANGLLHSSLEKLRLYKTPLGDHGCASLISCIPSTLKILLLPVCEITESSFQTILTFLATNRTLQKLSLEYNLFSWDDYLAFREQASELNNTCELY
jgi:hypothetical protein